MIGNAIDATYVDNDNIVVSQLYHFANGGYTLSDSIEAFKGYFIRASTAGTISYLSAASVEDTTISLNSSWNMISTSVDSIIVDNDSIIASQLYHFANGGYTLSVSIEANKGYFVRASSAGDIVLQQQEQSLISYIAYTSGDSSGKVYPIALSGWTGTNMATSVTININESDAASSFTGVVAKEDEPSAPLTPAIRLYKLIDGKHYPTSTFNFDLREYTTVTYPHTETVYIHVLPNGNDPYELSINLPEYSEDL